MTPDLELAFNVDVDRRLIWEGGASVRYVSAALSAPRLRVAADRPDHHLSIAMDLSAHPESAVLSTARSIAWRVADKLGERDTISLIGFGRRPTVLLPRTALDVAGKRAVREALGRMAWLEGCNLLQGWLASAEDCAQAMSDEEAHHRVILIASGRSEADTGSIVELATHARNLEARKLPTTCIAAGAAIDPARLVALDDSTINLSQAALEAGHISDALIFGCLELSPAIAFELEFDCKLQGAVTCEPLELLRPSGEVRIPKLARELRAGMCRLEIFRVKFPPGAPGTKMAADISVTFETDGHSARKQGSAQLTFARGRENSGQPRNISLSHQVAARWQLALLRDAIELMRVGANKEAERLLGTQLRYVEDYCRELPLGPQLLDMLKRSIRTLGL